MYSPEGPPPYRWAYPHDNETNHVAAAFHLLSVILTTTALFKMTWFHVSGSPCSSRLALYQFMPFSYMEDAKLKMPGPDTIIWPLVAESKEGCITSDVVKLMRVLIMLCTLSIIYSMIGFCLDIIGPSKKSLRYIRRNALPSIWSVLTVVCIVGICYLATRSLEMGARLVNATYPVLVTYEYGCYVVTAAGAVSLLATACNLLQDPPPTLPIESGPQRERLVDDEFDGLETFSVGMHNLPPPPPYTP